MCSAVSLRIRVQGSTRSPSQGSTAAAGAGARGCGAAGGRLGSRCSRRAAHRRRAGAADAAVDVADHVVLGDPPREPGARDRAQNRGRARRPSCAPAAWSGGAAAPRRSPPRRCSRRHCRRGTAPRQDGRGSRRRGGRRRSRRGLRWSWSGGRRRRLGRRGRRSGCGSRRGGPVAAARGSLRRAGGRLGVDPRHDRLHRDGLALLHQDLRQHARRRAPGSRRPPCRWRSRRSARRA